MGYQVTFKPTQEAMEKYKPWGFDKGTYVSAENGVREMQLNILTYCLKNHKEEGFNKIYKDLSFMVRLFKNYIEEEEKEWAYKRWLEDENNELWYCGWEFCREREDDGDILVNNLIEELVILTDVVETPNYFTDATNFNEKLTEISQKLDDYKQAFSDLTIHHIIKDLDEFKYKGDDDDDVIDSPEEEKKEEYAEEY